MGCCHEALTPMVRSHAVEPRNYGPLEVSDGHACITGPCGDTMEFWLVVQDDLVAQVHFTTDGCESSLACGSMTTCLATGKSVAEAMNIAQQDVLEALDGLPAEWEHCALLAANALRAACEDWASRGRQQPR